MKSLSVFRGNTEVYPGLSDIALEVGSEGPAIMILGDSYTRPYWVEFLLRNTSRVAWMHHRNCAFDYGAVIRFKPDLLIWAPVERATACQRWPDGLKDLAHSQVQTVQALPSDLDLKLKTETTLFEQVFRFPDTSLQGLSFDDVADLRRTVRGIEFKALNDPKIFFEMNSIGTNKPCVHLRVKVRLSVPNGGVSQLFYRAVGDGQFSEKNSRTLAVDPGDGEGAETVTFDIFEPRGFAARLRFDPVLRSQEVVLNDLEVWCGS
jgi:hypothetical protein